MRIAREPRGMTAYAVGHLRNVQMGPAIVEYVERIDSTLEPFGGRFIIHGAAPEVKEGAWTGDLIVIEFPDIERARAWYHSPAYQAIIPLRGRSSDGEILLIRGVAADHRATDILAAPGGASLAS
jgi:uncharacterized protein (DUF1330 family)